MRAVQPYDDMMLTRVGRGEDLARMMVPRSVKKIVPMLWRAKYGDGRYRNCRP